MIRIRSFTVRNRLAAFVLLAIAAGAIGVFLIVGLMLLAGLAVGGIALAAGMALANRLRGTAPSSTPPTALDPGLEVFADPVGRVGAGGVGNNDNNDSIGPLGQKLDP